MTLPDVGRHRPVAIRSSVDLPEPLPPITTVEVPGSSSRSIPRKTQRARQRKRLWIPSRVISCLCIRTERDSHTFAVATRIFVRMDRWWRAGHHSQDHADTINADLLDFIQS